MDKRRKPLWETGEPGVPALPGQEGACDPHDDWTEPEKWAWEQIRAGREANFHKKYDEFIDPRDDEAWEKDEAREQRLLSPEFLKAILLHQPWRGALTHVGVHIIGALFNEEINLANADIPCELWLEVSRIEQGINLWMARCSRNFSLEQSCVGGDARLPGIHINGSVSMSGSRFAGKLAMDGAVITGGLFMHSQGDQRAEFSGQVRLHGVQVGGQVAMVGARFASELAMDGAVITGGLFMHSQGEQRAEFSGAVGLLGVQVGGQVSMIGARFDEKVAMYGAQVGGEVGMEGARFMGDLAMDRAVIKGGLFMGSQDEQRAEFSGAVRLHGAQVGGQVDMTGARFASELAMDGAMIKGGLFMSGQGEQRAEFAGAVGLLGVQVGGQLDMHGTLFSKTVTLQKAVIGDMLVLCGAEIKAIDAGHVTVDGPLVMGEEAGRESKIGSLDLVSARVESIIDDWTPERQRQGIDPWPQELYLQNFTYHQLHGWPQREGYIPVTSRPAAWFKGWLARQRQFSPQPYEHCAKLLRAAGAPDKANAVLFACKQRQRRRASVLRWALKQGKGYQLKGGLLDFWKGVGLDAVRLALAPLRWVLRKLGFAPVKPVDPEPLRWLWQLFMQWTIGYGIGWRYTWSLGWAALLVGIGYWLLGQCEAGAAMCTSQKIAFSLGMFLPIIELSKEHGEWLKLIPDPWPLWYFYGMKIAGYGLAGLIIARLAGVGQHKTD